MSPRLGGVSVSLALWAAFATFLPGALAPAKAQTQGRVGCQALDNEQRAAASFRLYREGTQIAGGVCGKDQGVPAGSYELVVVLDGALGASEQRVALTVRAGATERPTLRYETGELLIEVTREGRRSTALVQLRDNDRSLAQLSAGVAARLIVGTYSLEIESRGEQRKLDAVTIARGERRVLGVEFGAPPK